MYFEQVRRVIRHPQIQNEAVREKEDRTGEMRERHIEGYYNGDRVCRSHVGHEMTVPMSKGAAWPVP